MQELFNIKLVFSWDLLHLTKGAHIDAKGSVTGEDLCEHEDESEQGEKEEKHEIHTLSLLNS